MVPFQQVKQTALLYQTSRAGAHARTSLHGWRCHLTADDYVGYKSLFTDGPTELACLAQINP
ncbi:IS66 family transposase [Duganella caerulea]|uniref:IS66 family transposase n=1 Tax=Duganella caerulea TaxID=2885762 RepID=UPI00403780DF